MQKNLIKAIFILFAVSCIFVFYKKISSDKVTYVTNVEPVVENSLPADFHDFYNKFHTDSVFQMSRISFPLTGVAQEGDSVLVIVEKSWKPEEWKIHKPFDNQNGTFERTFTNINGIISEKIVGNGGMFSIQKRYSKLANQWYLIYYQDMMMHG